MELIAPGLRQKADLTGTKLAKRRFAQLDHLRFPAAAHCKMRQVFPDLGGSAACEFFF